MFPSDASELQAEVMQGLGITQSQAIEWLDNHTPHWRTEEPNAPTRVSECDASEEQ